MRNAVDFFGMVAYLSLMYPWFAESNEAVLLPDEVNNSDDEIETGLPISHIDAVAATPADAGQHGREANASAA